MAAYRLRKEEEGKELLEGIPEDLIDAAVNGAIEGMVTSNKPVAEVMQQVPVNAATDVTGFGLKGHAANMAFLSKVDIVIDKTMGDTRHSCANRHFWVSTFYWGV